MPVTGTRDYEPEQRRTRAGPPECFVSRISGPPPKTTGDKTQKKGILLVPDQYVCMFGFKGASISKVIGARNEMMMDDYDGQRYSGTLWA